MKWRGHLVDHLVIDPLLNPAPGTCRRCGGSGVVRESIDDERVDVTVPCPQCRMWCKACKDWVKRTGHSCRVEP